MSDMEMIVFLTGSIGLAITTNIMIENILARLGLYLYGLACLWFLFTRKEGMK